MGRASGNGVQNPQEIVIIFKFHYNFYILLVFRKSAKPGKVSKWEPAPLEAPPKEVPSSEPPIILATLTDHQIKKEAVVPNIHTLSTGGLQPTYMNLPNAETSKLKCNSSIYIIGH